MRPLRFEQEAARGKPQHSAYRGPRAEPGSCLCAFKCLKPFLASIMAAAVQRIAMDGERQCLHMA